MLCIKLHPLKPWLHPLKSKMHPPPNRNCTPLTDFYQNYGSLPKKSSKLKGLLDFPFLSDSLNFPIFALERR